MLGFSRDDAQQRGRVRPGIAKHSSLRPSTRGVPALGKMAPLIGEDTKLSDEAVASVYQMNLDGLRQLFALVDKPPVPILDGYRLARIHTMLSGLLDLIQRAGPPAERKARIRDANTLYDAFLIALDMAKQSLDMPMVPRGSAKKAPASAAS
jgi:hypothetical protein